MLKFFVLTQYEQKERIKKLSIKNKKTLEEIIKPNVKYINKISLFDNFL